MLGRVVEQAVCCLQDRLGKLARLMSRTELRKAASEWWESGKYVQPIHILLIDLYVIT